MKKPENAEDARNNKKYLISLCKTLSTSVAYDTLMSLLHGPKSVADICSENKTPVSSTYKVVKDLQRLGLVSVKDIFIDEHGKRVTLYTSKVKSFKINLDKNGAAIEYVAHHQHSSAGTDKHDNNRNDSSIMADMLGDDAATASADIKL